METTAIWTSQRESQVQFSQVMREALETLIDKSSANRRNSTNEQALFNGRDIKAIIFKLSR